MKGWSIARVILPNEGVKKTGWNTALRPGLAEPAKPQLCSGPLFPLFFGGCPTKMVFPKKGSLFFQGH